MQIISWTKSESYFFFENVIRNVIAKTSYLYD